MSATTGDAPRRILGRGPRRAERVLARDRASAPLIWIVALMVLLAGLAVGTASALVEAATRWQAAFTGILTVEIPPLEVAGQAAPGVRSAAGRLADALAVLRATPGVVAAEPVDRRQVAELLAPWLGAQAAMNDLPLPQLIDLRLSAQSLIDLAELARRLSAAVPGARIDDHGRWTSGLTRLAGLVGAAALGIVGAVAVAGALAVALVTRARLALHREAVELMHLMGATDAFVARALSRDAAIAALAGGAFGLAAAVCLGAGLIAAAPGFVVEAAWRAAARPSTWAALAALPLAAAALAAIAAWLAARGELARMP